VLQSLIDHGGRLPDGPPVVDGYWNHILRDIERADHVVVNSEFVRTTFASQGWPPHRIHVLYWGVDDQFFRYAEASAPGEVNVSDQRGVELEFLFAGLFSRRKGADTLIEALAPLDHHPWKLRIAGKVEPAIRQRHASFFKNPRVTLLGNLSRAELARAMKRAEVFVFPSLAEGSARVIFEAMLCGCYIITTPNSGSIVREPEHGSLVPAGDERALREAILYAIANRTAGQRSESNVAVVRKSYRQSTYGTSILELYDAIIARES
jgi:glycosyltransferase involved in cell wall biosynthesis